MFASLGIASVKPRPSRGICRVRFKCGCVAFATMDARHIAPFDAEICGRVVSCRTSSWARDGAIQASTNQRQAEVRR